MVFPWGVRQHLSRPQAGLHLIGRAFYKQPDHQLSRYLSGPYWDCVILESLCYDPLSSLDIDLGVFLLGD